MDHKEMRAKAKEGLKGYCRVCPVCDGRVCAGEVPGMGGLGTGSSFKENLAALARVRLVLRTLHGVTEADTSTNLFGSEQKTPVQAAPMTGVAYNMGGALSEEAFIGHVVRGCKEAGTLPWTGDGASPVMYDSGLAAIQEAGVGGVAIIKPRAQDEIITRIRKAEDAGATAVGVDVDGAGLITMAQFGQPVGPKNPEELAELVAATSLPFVVKGVMSKDEAKVAAKAGAAAIVVSNHGGRVLDHTPGTADVLHKIAKAVGDKLTVFVDGGVRTGADVLKLLALGAHGVLVGRPLVTGAFGGGDEGVAAIINKMTTECVQAMLLTGTASVREVSSDILA